MPRCIGFAQHGFRQQGVRIPRAIAALVAGSLVVGAVAGGARPASAATVLFADGFESGNFSAWTLVSTAGDGTAAVQSATVRTGSFAAQLSESAASGSKAYIRKTLGAAQTDVTVAADFYVTQEGASGGNVPFFRLLDAASNRIVNVYRQNATNGEIGLGYAGGHFSTTGSLALNTWGNLSAHLVVAGATSTVEIRLNGALVYQVTNANLGTAPVVAFQLGNDTAAQAFALVADNAEVDIPGQSGTAPHNTSPPTITGTAQVGQTLTANPGTWSGTTPITYSYAWQRCDGSGNNCTSTGVTTTTYNLSAADQNSTMRVQVTGTNGVAPDGTASSGATAVVQQPPGLVALWHMDETSGSSMNDAVGNHTGTLHSVQLGAPGYTGTAYGFDGSSSYVSVPSSSDLNPGSANLTMTIQVKTTSAPASPDWDLIRKGYYTTSGGEFKMEYQPSGQASCGFNGSVGYNELIAGPSIEDGKWHTVQCVKTSTAIKLIVDGQTFTKSGAVGTISNTEPVIVGARPNSEFFNGYLDDASIQIGSVGQAPSISGTPPSPVDANTRYAFAFTLSGTPAPSTSVTAGSLPPGIALSSAGELSGSAVTAGSYTATVTATNGVSPDATTSFTIVVTPTVTVVPDFGPPGTAVTLNGTGYVPGETVAFKYKTGMKPKAIGLCSAVATADGTATCSANIPTTNTGAPGAHTIVAKGNVSLIKAKTSFTLT